MKTTHRLFSAFAALTTLFLVTGCNTVSINSYQYLGGQSYPPSNPAPIEILRKAPVRPHVQLGEVRAEPASDRVSVQKIETTLREAAAKMGADAIVIVHDRTEITGEIVTGPWYGYSIQQVMGRVIVGIAIKYTGESGNRF